MGSRGVGGRGCEEERPHPGVEKPSLAAWGVEGVSRAPDGGPWIRLAATTFQFDPSVKLFSPPCHRYNEKFRQSKENRSTQHCV